MYPALLLILAAAFATLAWRNLRLALILLAGLLPTYLLRFSIGPIPFTLLEVFILTAAGIWLTKHHGWKIDLRSIRPWHQPLLLVLAAASFGVSVAPDSIAALGIWKAYFLEPALVFLMMRAMFKDRHDWHMALKTLCVSAVVISLFAITQYFSGLGIPEPWDIERRVTSIFDYPNALGLFLSPIAAIATVMFVRAQTWWRAFWVTTLGLSVLSIILAQTEAALIALPAGLILTLLFSDAKKKTKLRITGESVLILAILTLLIPAVAQKLFLQDYSGQVRISQWSESVQMLAHKPAFGAGLSGYPEALEPYHDPTLYEIFQYPHNILLNIWSELGLLGLAAFAWLIVLTVKTILREPADRLKLAAFAALTVMTVHGLVDVPYFKNDLSVMTWVLIAIMSLPPATKKRAHSTSGNCGC